MSRSGYTEGVDCDWSWIMWRGAVASAIRGARGQSFLLELRNALDALPEKRLIAHELEQDGEVCAIGAVGLARRIDMASVDPDDRENVADVFGIAPALAAEIAYMNDEAIWSETPEERWQRMSKWVDEQLSGHNPG